MESIHQLVTQEKDTIIAHRRHIHAHPETSGNERETASYIADQLRQMGLTPTEHVGGYGVTALIEGKGPGRCVGLRADIDALSIPEKTGLPFASQNEGISHACGHDCHAAMLLGAAKVLASLRDSFSGTVKLVFQPSEENSADSGALRMIKDGVLQNPPVDVMIGQHMQPDVPTGQISLREGSMTASSDRFFIDIIGKACHGSAPHQGVDAIVIAAEVVLSLQSIVSRMADPFDNSVLTIGVINGGDRYNIVPGSVHMEGTCRNANPALRDAIAARMEKTVRNITEMYGAACEFRYVRGYSPLQNDASLVRRVVDAAQGILGQEQVNILPHPSMGGEDFSFYSYEVPSVFYWLGCRTFAADGTVAPLHNNAFTPDEDALPIGCELMVTAALKELNRP